MTITPGWQQGQRPACNSTSCHGMTDMSETKELIKPCAELFSRLHTAGQWQQLQKPGLGFRPSSQDLLKLSQIQSLVDHIDVAIQDLEDGNGGQVGRRHDVALPTVDHDRERRDTLIGGRHLAGACTAEPRSIQQPVDSS